ncbi:MAG: cellulase family glycosylhydrolase [Lachnospiraceae bacterium]|nr:cellulase family glycosylhydrolase [Lachnospiraceae bacterium]
MKEWISNHKKGSVIAAIVIGICLVAAIVLIVIRCVTGAWPWSPKETIDSAKTTATDNYDDIRNFKGLVVTISKVNGWQSNNESFAQYNVSVENHKSSEVTSWKMSIPTTAQYSADNNWNCNLNVAGSSLNFSNVDYNGTIATDNTISDIGMILKAKSDADLGKLEGTYIIDKETAMGRLLSKEELQALRQAAVVTPANNTMENASPKPTTESGTPVDNHGALRVNGVDLVDSKGEKIQLKGVSTHGLQWFPEYVNEGAFRTLRDDWGANVVRLAMYTDENGYCAGGDKAKLEQVIDDGVNIATGLGMYVIIDWHILHDNNPMTHEAEAIDFFSRMSARYADRPNVLYEICNEPNGGTSWETIRGYANDVIPAIRANDNDAIVLVGTPTWSQDVDKVSAAPLDFENVMYTLHFYAGTHKDDLRRKLTTARESGTPIFVSEFSICDSSGNGGIDYNSANAWKQLINDNNLSYVGWSLCNKNETSALLSPSCSTVDSFTDADLSETGTFLKAFISGN